MRRMSQFESEEFRFDDPESTLIGYCWVKTNEWKAKFHANDDQGEATEFAEWNVFQQGYIKVAVVVNQDEASLSMLDANGEGYAAYDLEYDTAVGTAEKLEDSQWTTGQLDSLFPQK